MLVMNTLNGKKEELIPLNPPVVNIYVCGPTTYNFIHLGNARPLAVFDTLRRYLAYKGYQVNYVQNFTDIDDKIIKKASEENMDSLQLAEKYIMEYYFDADAIGIKRADKYPRVSEHLAEIIDLIAALIEKGFAYELEGDVYYRVKAFAEYGKLSGRSFSDMQAGARVEVDKRKEEAADFALWKKAKNGEPAWESPWGKGRPGWHIECSAMSMKYLGNTIDIHGGGADLIFPHHENEIAQSEAVTGKPFAKYWMHNGFITVNNEKMSKSLGNFFILRDILQKYPGDAVRFYLIATHYRSPLDFDDNKLTESKKALGRLKNTMQLMDEFKNVTGEYRNIDDLNPSGREMISQVEKNQELFLMAMEDDLNTAKAIGFLFEISHAINIFMAQTSRSDNMGQVALRKAEVIFKELGNILGIFMDNKDCKNAHEDDVIRIFVELRNIARQEKKYELSDKIRDALKIMDISLEDGKEGTRIVYENADIDIIMQQLIKIRTELKSVQQYQLSDFIRDQLKKICIVLEDTSEGVRYKIVDA